MKGPRRRPQPAASEGLITDRRALTKLLHGDEELWEKLGHPEFGGKAKITPAEYEQAKLRVLKEAPLSTRSNLDEHTWAHASADAWMRRQDERTRFLLRGDYLAGAALATALAFSRHQ